MYKIARKTKSARAYIELELVYQAHRESSLNYSKLSWYFLKLLISPSVKLLILQLYKYVRKTMHYDRVASYMFKLQMMMMTVITSYRNRILHLI